MTAVFVTKKVVFGSKASIGTTGVSLWYCTGEDFEALFDVQMDEFCKWYNKSNARQENPRTWFWR
eukprot:13109423-Ditylum_brightwellii.AAC.1